MTSPGLKWCAEPANQSWCRYEAARYATGDREMQDELTSYMAERSADVAATWDGVSCSLNHHMRTNLRWYALKKMRRIRRESSLGGQDKAARLFTRRSMCAADDVTQDSDARTVRRIDDRDELRTILSSLDTQQRAVLISYVMMGMTFAEIAEDLGMHRAAVSRAYREALSAARAVVGVALPVELPDEPCEDVTLDYGLVESHSELDGRLVLSYKER